MMILVLAVLLQSSFVLGHLFEFLTDINSKCIRTVRHTLSTDSHNHSPIKQHCSSSAAICRKNFIQGNNANHIAAKMCRDDILKTLYEYGGSFCNHATTFWGRKTIYSIWEKNCLAEKGQLELKSGTSTPSVKDQSSYENCPPSSFQKTSAKLGQTQEKQTQEEVTPHFMHNSEDIIPHFKTEDVMQVNIKEKSAYRYTINNKPRKIPLIYEIPFNEESKYPIFNRGLMNSGNTCFLNSAVQILMRSSVFRSAIRSSTSEKKLTKIFKKHLSEFSNEGYLIDIADIAVILGQSNNIDYEFGDQMDMAEAIFGIFKILDEEQDNGAYLFSSMNTGLQVSMSYKISDNGPVEKINSHILNSETNIQLTSRDLLDQNDADIDLEDFIVKKWNFIEQMSTPDFSKFEKIQMKELPRLLVINIDNDEFENDQYLKFRNVFRDISIPQELKFFNSEKQIIYKFVGVGHHSGGFHRDPYVTGGHWESTACWNNQCVHANDRTITPKPSLFCVRPTASTDMQEAATTSVVELPRSTLTSVATQTPKSSFKEQNVSQKKNGRKNGHRKHRHSKNRKHRHSKKRNKRRH